MGNKRKERRTRNGKLNSKDTKGKLKGKTKRNRNHMHLKVCTNRQKPKPRALKREKSRRYLERWRQCWCGGLGLLMCVKGGGPALLEVISVDYRARVQCTMAPCNLPPWKIDAADEWSDTCTYRERRTRGWIVVKTNWTAWGDDNTLCVCARVWNYTH